MKKKLESIRMSCKFKKEVSIDESDYEKLKVDIYDSIVTELHKVGISIKRYNLTVVSTEKTISEVLYQERNYRIIKTKTCKALVQKKKRDKESGSYIWKDKAFYSTGTETECYNKAKTELDRLKKKRTKRSSKSRTTSRKQTLKQKYLDNIPEGDMELLKKSLN